MKKKGWKNLVFLSCLLASPLWAVQNIVNVYAWPGEIPDEVIQQFEKETGIKVNFSTYDSNETMYAKLQASKNAGYDVIEPSSYYVDRMRKQGMLEKFDKTLLPNFKNLNPDFLHQKYDPQSDYSSPFMWGVTGIFVNSDYFKPSSLTRWSDLWDSKFENQLLLLDDSREVFSMALKALGYSANDTNPEHIKEAYLKLKSLSPNIKIFKSDGVITILIDEDATVGMAWNGDVYKARKENPSVQFIYPKEGFVIWVDNLAIVKNAPNRANAYKFINFLLRPDIAAKSSLSNGYPTPNLAAERLLPTDVKNDRTIYPAHDVLKHGEFQTDIDDQSLNLYEKYWEKLKMAG